MYVTTYNTLIGSDNVIILEAIRQCKEDGTWYVTVPGTNFEWTNYTACANRNSDYEDYFGDDYFENFYVSYNSL